MKAWFLGLNERERLIVLGGAATVLLFVVWYFLVVPLRGGASELRADVTDKQRLLLDVRRAAAIAPEAAAPAAGGSGQSLVVLIDSTAQGFGLDLPRKRPDGADGINVSFQSVSFDALLRWLIELDATHGVRVESASFSSARERGLVNGQLFLRRS
jgi:type II secretory pathway component PulM